MGTHRFLQFESPQPHRRMVREIAVALMNYYLNANLSRSKWLKVPRQPAKCFDAPRGEPTKRREWLSKPIDVRTFESHLESGTFDYASFELVDPRCDWLDASVQGGPAFHAVGADGNALRFLMPTTLGPSFPLVPTIDREGYAFNSFQLLLLDRILDLRNAVVAASDTFSTGAWFQNLRAFICECVSLVDVTLHQIYYKAEHSPLPGWVFDPARLGPRHGRRLLDKLAWIYQITGNPLHADAETRTLRTTKGLRNHLQHFDPPCFCYTLEDVARWLNGMHDIATLAWKMSTAMGSSLCVPLIRMLLAPRVIFVAADSSRPRVPQPADVGYGSTALP